MTDRAPVAPARFQSARRRRNSYGGVYSGSRLFSCFPYRFQTLANPTPGFYIATMVDAVDPDAGGAFLKMHGLGNDFVVLDRRAGGMPVSPRMARLIGDRRTGVGFDQLVVIRPSDEQDVSAEIDFWNRDGSTAGACGNGTRCVARLLLDEGGTDRIFLRTQAGLLSAVDQSGVVSVNMGSPALDWSGVPLREKMPVDPLPLDGGPAAVGMGNPHCVFVVDDVEAVDLSERGPMIETHGLFPEGTNVEFIQRVAENTIRMRVWERNTGITRACGSGACAAAVVAAQRGLTGRRVTVRLDGGDLEIDWRDDGVWMSGPTAVSFEGTLSSEMLS